MGLKTKFNLAMLAAFLVGLSLAAALLYGFANADARREVLREAAILMNAASAVRSYTVGEITPLLAEQGKLRFLPHTVPSWAAQTNMRNLQKEMPSYVYKEASLNPTNPADRASDWESDIVGEFTRNQGLTEFVSERDSALGPTLSLSKPIRLKDPACLACHSTPAAAPATMIDLYGPANGFGWKLNEVVGVQIVTVPLQVALDRANKTLQVYLGGLAAVFLVVIVLLNILLTTMIVRPVRRMSAIADEISTGNMNAPEIEPKGRDEIASLAASFNRMRRSLENAMKLLEG
jgi:HAMP domain-containing protein